MEKNKYGFLVVTVVICGVLGWLGKKNSEPYVAKFIQGECIEIKENRLEKWETPLRFKINDVGTESYRLIWWNEKGKYTDPERGSLTLPIELIDRTYFKIQCPN